ncbi:MAG: hypothetical protein R2881_00095 [Eubacteriales bacterium]
MEKARVDYAGSYQAIVSCFARYAVEPDTLYINPRGRLRRGATPVLKMSYRPIRLIEKYWVTIE